MQAVQTCAERPGGESKRREIFNGRSRGGARTYFLDVSESSGGDRLLSICESRASQSGFQRQRILISAAHADEFVRCFRHALRALKTGNYASADE